MKVQVSVKLISDPKTWYVAAIDEIADVEFRSYVQELSMFRETGSFMVENSEGTMFHLVNVKDVSTIKLEVIESDPTQH